jgi:hypothetical protein
MTLTDAHTESVEPLEERDRKALQEPMDIAPIGGDIWEVYSNGRGPYRVDLREGRCTCPDAKYNHPTNGCKHLRRVRYAAGRREPPHWIRVGALDTPLRNQLERSDNGLKGD